MWLKTNINTKQNGIRKKLIANYLTICYYDLNDFLIK